MNLRFQTIRDLKQNGTKSYSILLTPGSRSAVVLESAAVVKASILAPSFPTSASKHISLSPLITCSPPSDVVTEPQPLVSKN